MLVLSLVTHIMTHHSHRLFPRHQPKALFIRIFLGIMICLVQSKCMDLLCIASLLCLKVRLPFRMQILNLPTCQSQLQLVTMNPHHPLRGSLAQQGQSWIARWSNYWNNYQSKVIVPTMGMIAHMIPTTLSCTFLMFPTHWLSKCQRRLPLAKLLWRNAHLPRFKTLQDRFV